MYLSYEEFTERFAPLSELMRAEVKERAVKAAIERAEANLHSRLSVRYDLPLNLTEISAPIIKRFVFYLTIKELLAANAVVMAKQDGEVGFLNDVLELIEKELDNYSNGNYVLPDQSVKLRPIIGLGFVGD